jgi:hypothetical protein
MKIIPVLLILLVTLPAQCSVMPVDCYITIGLTIEFDACGFNAYRYVYDCQDLPVASMPYVEGAAFLHQKIEEEAYFNVILIYGQATFVHIYPDGTMVQYQIVEWR